MFEYIQRFIGYNFKNEKKNDKTLISSNEYDENEKQNNLLSNVNNANAKNKKNSTNIEEETNKKKKMRIKTFY